MSKHLYISSEEELLTVIKAPISYDTASDLVCKFLNVRIISFTSTERDVDQKAVLIQQVEDYLFRFKDIPPPNRPIFLAQRNEEFSITDFYNHD